jgi:high-affinity K+ transport system ATPase subunit B
MTVINPNLNFPKKENEIRERNISTKYGAIEKPTVKWTYNFDPLKKMVVILFFALLFAGFTNHMIQESNKKDQANYLKIEAEKERREYIERRLEIIKKETIAAEMTKIKK